MFWQTAAAQAMSTTRAEPVRDETCRQVLRVTDAGSRIRLHLSNAMSSTPLTLEGVSAGIRRAGAALAGPPQPVTVGGSRSIVIAPGAAVMTDPVDLAVRRGADVAVSFAVSGTARLSAHLFGAATGWCTAPGSGDHAGDVGGGAFGQPSRRELVLEAVDVQTAAARRDGILAVGDSLTDPPLPPDTYARWTDVLSARTGRPVVNLGIAGNRVVLPGGYGPVLTERFDRDVLHRSGAGTVILFGGTNDVSTGISAPALIAQLQGLCARARADHLKVVLVTLAPAWKRPAAQDAVRRAVNAWIRTTPAADARLDADLLLRDPNRPTHLLPAYDWGDGLHLSASGHRALGDAMAAVVAASVAGG